MATSCDLEPATPADAHAIAELVDFASDGVALIEWTDENATGPDIEPYEIGARTYARELGNYSYRNVTVARVDGVLAGMLLAFPMAARDPSAPPPPGPPFDGDDVFAPYRYLEAPDSWYVCGVACYPEWRGHGIGTRLMAHAADQAVAAGFARLSLVAFAENRGAVDLYRRLGYAVVNRAPMVPHPLIRQRGEALLMVADATPR